MILAAIFLRQPILTFTAALLWKTSRPNTLLHRATEAMLHGWGIRIDEHTLLDQGLVPITEEEAADGPPTTVR